MNPLQRFGEKCYFYTKSWVPDGSGGFELAYEKGVEFTCAITKSGSTDQLIAQQQGNKGAFTIMVPVGLPIDFHDVFQVEKTGRFYRVTEDPDDMTVPELSDMGVKQGKAESYEMVI